MPGLFYRRELSSRSATQLPRVRSPALPTKQAYLLTIEADFDDVSMMDDQTELTVATDSRPCHFELNKVSPQGRIVCSQLHIPSTQSCSPLLVDVQNGGCAAKSGALPPRVGPFSNSKRPKARAPRDWKAPRELVFPSGLRLPATAVRTIPSRLPAARHNPFLAPALSPDFTLKNGPQKKFRSFSHASEPSPFPRHSVLFVLV